jgi:FkbM family methyltransferase
MWGAEECQRILAEFQPGMGRYGWMWTILRWRARQTGFPPRKLYPLFRRFCRPGRPYFVGMTGDGVAFLGDYRDRYSVDHMVSPDEIDPLTAFLLNRARQTEGAILDVGANVGLVAAELARALPERPVIAFEPTRETSRRAAATFALNHLDNIRLLPAAVGETDGELTFYSAPGHSDYASAHPTDTHLAIAWTETKVPCVALDTLRIDSVFGRVGLLKVDVEGHEFAVLRGAKTLITQDRPHILLEYNRRIAPQMGWTPTDVAEFLASLAPYCFHTLNHDGTPGAFPPKEIDTGIVNIYAEPCTGD